MSKTETMPDAVMPAAQPSAVDSGEATAEDVRVRVKRAEAEAAAAEAVAAQARARVIRLQQQAQDSASVSEAEHRGEPAAADRDSSWRRRTRALLAGFRWRQLAAAGSVLCACVLLVASALMLRSQQTAQAQERNRAEFVAAARQAVVTLMSIDFNDPQGSVQRIVDNSTGPFRDEFLGAADDFSRVAKDAKVTTKATATAASVESMTSDSAVVLVSASSTVTNAAGADESPRRWRLTVDLRREGDQIKMSKVEFVP
ncbi:hypothetical protein [Mycobacterium sp. UM_Kg1]|uniref:hypothetical protein n=1 Tax=Mycobacterium sp. UM_Kg1 TaxID=1545691 RepID=UPI000AF9BCC4|nr:hypothetical protein [Mycobacterium sp. UM_Kg1]